MNNLKIKNSRNKDHAKISESTVYKIKQFSPSNHKILDTAKLADVALLESSGSNPD